MAKLRRRTDRSDRFELDYVDIDGARYRINTGTDDPLVADLWLKKVEERLSQARLGLIEKVGPISADTVAGRAPSDQPDALTLEGFQEEYEERCRHDLEMDENTIELANTSFKSIIGVVGNKRLSKLVQEDIIRWKRRLDAEGKKKTTVSIYYRTLRAAFNRAVRWQMVEANPFLNIDFPTPRKGDRPRKYMTTEEVKKLLSVVEQEKPNFALYLKFLLNTGCRRNEILFLRWEDIDLEKKTLRVMADKTDKVLLLPINKSLYDIITGMNPETGFVFKTSSTSRNRKKQGQPWHESTVSHWFRQFATQAGLPEHYTLHCLRHTFTNYLRERGVPIDVIQRLLGHSTVRTTWDHYDASDALFFRQQADLIDFGEEMNS